MASPRAPSVASSASASAGTCRTLKTGKGMRSRSPGLSCPCNWTASRPRRAAMAATSRAGRSAKTPTSSGPLPGASLARAAVMSASSLVIRQGARRAGHEVEADGVSPGCQRRGQPGHLRDAADLDEGRAAVRGRVHAGRGNLAGRHVRRHPRLHGRGIAAGAHEVLADERGIEAGRPPAARGGRLAQAGLGHHEAIVRHQVAQAHGQLHVHPERPQVAVVDADESGVRADRRAQLALVVRLHEWLQPELEGQCDEPGQLPRADGGRPAAGRRPRRPHAAAAAGARRRRTPWPAPATTSQPGRPGGPRPSHRTSAARRARRSSTRRRPDRPAPERPRPAWRRPMGPPTASGA